MGIITPMAQNFATPESSWMMFLFGTDHNQILELASAKMAIQGKWPPWKEKRQVAASEADIFNFR